jgi:5-methyltetrahydrofolate--homocysteine methyltransferase
MLGPNGAEYPLSAEGLATAMSQFVREFGVSLVGGCCGTTPAHIRAVVDAISGVTRGTRDPQPEPAVASLYQSVPFKQDASVLMIGERTNSVGSKAFREAMLEARYNDASRSPAPRSATAHPLARLRGLRRARRQRRHARVGPVRHRATLPLMSTPPNRPWSDPEMLGGRCRQLGQL